MNPSWFKADWPAPPGIRVLATLRGPLGASKPPYACFNLGDHVGDDPAAVAENRRQLQDAAGLPAPPSWLTQVHGAHVADLDSPAPLRPADAAITRRAGTVCAILTADCLPIMLATDSGDIIAAAHAGWRGLVAGVIAATVRAMGTPAAHISAWLGPAIGAKHFEVGGEVRDAFLRADPQAAVAFQPNFRGRFMADLEMLARRQLKDLGVERVYGGGECTYACADRYFSHRRDGLSGRQATLIWREPSE